MMTVSMKALVSGQPGFQIWNTIASLWQTWLVHLPDLAFPGYFFCDYIKTQYTKCVLPMLMT